MSAQRGLCLWIFYIIILPYLVSTRADQSENYIVHMDLSAMPKAFSTQHSWYLATLSSTAAEPTSVSSKLIYSYSNVMNGFSARLSPSELNTLKSSPGYISSFLDLTVTLDTTHSPQFLRLNPLAGAWPASDYGKDIVIGLVDTGVWPESQSYNDQGMSEIPSRWKGECESGTQFNSSMCNKKLIGARFFNKGLIAKHPNVTIRMNSARDTKGHGTHTSTTAAGSRVEGVSYFGYASGSATGMAPRARVAMYKVFWEEYGRYTSDVIAAIDSAIADGVDILSLSFGFDDKPLYEDPVAIATYAAMENGIFVATSAGNEGPDLQTLHNGSPWVTTVAASTLDREFHAILNLGNQVSLTGLSLYVGNFSAARFPLVFMGSCDNLKKLIKVRSKIVVCEDRNKNSSVMDQFVNLDKAKVLGGIFISNSSDVASILEFSDYPTIFISPVDGEILKDYVKKSKSPKASLAFKITSLGTTRAPSVDSYSSRGPSQSCPFVLKPDVTAPGTLILAAWPPNVPVARVKSHSLFSNIRLDTGTSMACPHVAGIAALLKGAHPEWSPAAIRSAIMTSSDMLDNNMGMIRDIGDMDKPASPLALGAGHINPNKALDPGLVYDAGIEDYVNLLCALNYTDKNIRTITRSFSHKCSTPSLDLNYPSFIAFFNGKDSSSAPHSKIVREFHRTVTNVGEGPAVYKPSITPIQGFNVNVIPNVLVFAKKNEKLSYMLRIQGPEIMRAKVAFGQLIWSDKTHSVRSPIVVTRLSSKPILSHN